MDFPTVIQILDSAVRLMVPLLLACLAGGVAIALQTRRPEGLLAGLAAGVMHMAWSAGFWRQWLARRPAAPQGATA